MGLVYTLNDKVKLFTEHRYVLEEYEIAQGNRTGRVLQHKQNTTGFGIEYAPTDEWTLKSSAGYAYNRSFKFVDNPDSKAVLDESVYVTFEILGRF